MKSTYIYVLKCPTTSEVRYVGKANNPKERYHHHLSVANDKGTHKRNWINSLRQKSLKPVFKIIKEVQIDEWKYWEKYFIKYYRDKGCKLVNMMGGGEGLSFGIQTSFKKGNIPWNKGTRIKKKCATCNKKFEVSPSRKERYKCCSMECSSVYRSAHTNKGQFKKGHVPWSKGGGYTTSRKGQKVPEEVKKKISDTLRGRLNTGNSKPVVQVDVDTNIIIKEYPSAAEAGRVTGIGSSKIINNINGYSQTAGGLKWKRKENL